MAERLIISPNVSDEVKSFRQAKAGDGCDGNWIVFGYEGRNTIVVVGRGSGGLSDEFRSLFFATNTDARYALYRRDWKVELANTVKFILLDYTPDSIAPMRKALLSTHKGQIKELFKPFSANFEISKAEELNEEQIEDKIGEASGTKSNITTKTANTHQAVDITRSTAKPSSNLVPDSVQANRPVNFADESSIRAAIAEVRNDNSATNWCLVHYSNPTTLELVGSGSGGVEELIQNLNDNEVFYAFFRVVEIYDKTNNVKFCFLRLISPNLPPMQKGKLTTQSGFIMALFQPFHTDFDIQTAADISPDIIVDKVQRLQNTKQVVLSDEEKAARNPQQNRKASLGPSAVPHSAGGAQISFDNEAEFKSALSSVRNGENDFIVVNYSGRDRLAVLSTGTGGVEAAKFHFQPDNINFALVRVVDIIDKSATTKFVYVKFQPETVPAMKKSAISTKKGQYDALFSPYHVNFEISTPEEINEQIVTEKVQLTSGSKKR
jgi:hypothetical protein